MQGPYTLGEIRDYHRINIKMKRREFITKAALASAIASSVRCLGATPASATRVEGAKRELIDTHVYTSRWPFRRLTNDSPEKLREALRNRGVSSAWIGSFDGLLHRDVGAVNARLAAECAESRGVTLVPFGTVNLTLLDWEDDLRRCDEVYGMPGVRLHPDFHGYSLDDPRFVRLVEMATARGLIIQIALGMEDERTQHPLARVAPAHPRLLIGVLEKQPKARIMLLNYFRSFGADRALVTRLAAFSQIYLDIAMIETLAGIEAVLRRDPKIQLVFGSYAPYYQLESAILKLTESVLTDDQMHAIKWGRASALLGSKWQRAGRE